MLPIVAIILAAVNLVVLGVVALWLLRDRGEQARRLLALEESLEALQRGQQTVLGEMEQRIGSEMREAARAQFARIDGLSGRVDALQGDWNSAANGLARRIETLSNRIESLHTPASTPQSIQPQRAVEAPASGLPPVWERPIQALEAISPDPLLATARAKAVEIQGRMPHEDGRIPPDLKIRAAMEYFEPLYELANRALDLGRRRSGEGQEWVALVEQALSELGLQLVEPEQAEPNWCAEAAPDAPIQYRHAVVDRATGRLVRQGVRRPRR